MDKDKLEQESEKLAEAIVRLCENKQPNGNSESASIIMNALLNSAASLGVAARFSPESIIKGFVEIVQTAYNATGKWKVSGSVVHNEQELRAAMAEAGAYMGDNKAFDANDYGYGPLFDTGRPKTKHEVN